VKTNLVSEIPLAIVSGLLIVAAFTLLYTNKIDFTQVTLILGLVAGLWGVKGALNAPSPQQQETLQQLISQMISVIEAQLSPPTPARAITSNAYIPPEVRQQLGVPARASAVASDPNAIKSIRVDIPTGGNPAFPDAPQS